MPEQRTDSTADSSPRLILAPMQGLTELLFRRVYEQCFPGAFRLAVSPFLSLTHGDLSAAWEKIDDVLPEPNQGSIPVIPQILGKEPEEFVALANRLYEIGYPEVNWNIGCPVRRVAAKHRGSGILPYPGEVRAILEHVVPHLKGTLSVKMRLGLRSPDEIFSIIPVLNDFPLASVTVHPRTGKQQYGGQVDLDTFGRALPLIHHHVIYNGDIHTLADYRRIHCRFPQINDFMLGRGVLYNPQLPLQIQLGIRNEELGISNSQFSTLNSQFITALVDAIYASPTSDEAHMRKTKEYWCLLWRSLNITQQQASAVLHAPDATQTRQVLEKILSSA